MRATSPYARSISSSDHVNMDSGEPDAKRRKLRKGTRSCWGSEYASPKSVFILIDMLESSGPCTETAKSSNARIASGTVQELYLDQG
jgi:hypothetical protein